VDTPNQRRQVAKKERDRRELFPGRSLGKSGGLWPTVLTPEGSISWGFTDRLFLSKDRVGDKHSDIFP